MLSVIALAAAVAAAQASAPAASTAQEDKIKKMEMDRAAAVVKADVAALEKATSDDYTFINRSGQLRDRTQALGDLKDGRVKYTAYDVSDLRVRVYGGHTAIVTGRIDAKGTLGERDISGAALFTRVYVKKDGGWQSVAFQQTPVATP